MIRRGTTGSGLTQKPTVSWDDNADESDPEIAALLECATLDGLIEQVERECFSVMEAAGLPTAHDSYIFDRFGEWRDGLRSNNRITVANEIWPIARARGFEPDSKEGFAARMLSDIVWLQESRYEGDHDRAALFAFYLGVKRSEMWIKREHGTKSRPAQPARKRDRDVAMAREFLRRKETSRLSESALKAAIGREQAEALGRSSAIEAVNRGLKVLSG